MHLSFNYYAQAVMQKYDKPQAVEYHDVTFFLFGE